MLTGSAAPDSRADQVLEGLDPEQREVATCLSGPVCVLAGAGTGKTRAITHRIAYGVHSGVYVPAQVLAVTFTARAAGQMRTRLRALGVGGVQARTFHAAALRQLSYFWPKAVGGAPPNVQEHKAALVADAAARLRITVDRPAIRDLAAEVEWAKVSLLTPQTYPAAATAAGRGEPAGLDLVTVARLLELYEDVKTERNVIDFEDVLLLTVGILQEFGAIRAAVQQQYRHFVVDEYQDVNALQQRLLDLWLGDRRDVCVVGDPSQTIYSFTGASATHLLEFRTRYPDSALVTLVRDYRSSPQVVALANSLLAGRSASGHAPLRLIARGPDGPPPKLTAHADDDAEAVAVAAQVTTLIAGGLPPSQIAILYRTNGQSQAFEQALTDAGVAYLVRGGERFFARTEVRDAVMLLRGAARAGGSAGSLPDEARAVLAAAGWSALPPTGSGAVRERWESLQALAVLADGLAEQNPQAGLRDLVTELEERVQAQHAPTVEGVTLASLHAAKGLEWDAVFLVGLSEGLLPISFAQGWEEIEEERRLLYVGITRARRHLHLSWSRSRALGGRASRSPSRFLVGPDGASLLDGVPGARPTTTQAAQAGRRPSGATAGAGPSAGQPITLPQTCRSCGSALTTAGQRKIGRCATCPPTYDDAVLHRLRTWRADTAAAAGVPAYVVFTDATLIAIAETVPQELPQLARIPGVGAAKLAKYGADVLQVLDTAPSNLRLSDTIEIPAEHRS